MQRHEVCPCSCHRGVPTLAWHVNSDDCKAGTSDVMIHTHGILSMFRMDLLCNCSAGPISRALDLGADLVICGRCTDSALALGPLMHTVSIAIAARKNRAIVWVQLWNDWLWFSMRSVVSQFNWSWNDFDLISAGTLAGHLIECGAQSTGGICTQWETVRGWENTGEWDQIASLRSAGRNLFAFGRLSPLKWKRSRALGQVEYFGIALAYVLTSRISDCCVWQERKYSDYKARRYWWSSQPVYSFRAIVIRDSWSGSICSSWQHMWFLPSAINGAVPWCHRHWSKRTSPNVLVQNRFVLSQTVNIFTSVHKLRLCAAHMATTV